jgi:nucleoside-diphosphate-sugar epimerase
MNIAVTGGGGFLGRRLALALLQLEGVERVTLVDASKVAPFSSDRRIDLLQADLLSDGAVRCVAEGTDVIFHLAAVVSGQAESDFDLGMRVNLDATRSLLEAARSGQRRPRFIFTSSLAVFGPPLPEVVTEESAVHPGSSYGAEKAMGELLVSDYSRRGFVDGRVLRLPTVCVRPGKPNAAASSFVSGIIREPIAGMPANCPVGRDLELWLSSPRTAVANLVHAAFLPGDAIGSNRVVNLPGITVTVGEMIDSLGRLAGRDAAERITFNEDQAVKTIVASWPARFDVTRALALGFSRDHSFDALIADYLASEATIRQDGQRP